MRGRTKKFEDEADKYTYGTWDLMGRFKTSQNS